MGLYSRISNFIETHVVPNHENKWGSMRWDRLYSERIIDSKALELYGYKVFSQNDEDGIIDEIFNRIGVKNHIFIEFGVQDGLECNSHLLLLDGWKGMFIEGSSKYCEMVRKNFSELIDSNQLILLNSFITKDNINDLIKSADFPNEIDLLSIDIDGNDYHIWKEIDSVNPRVVVIEYNAKIPPSINWIMKYKDDHVWDYDDYFGASLKAMELLGREKGYRLVGTNVTGANAFFVREDLAGDLFYSPATAEALYNPAKYYIKFISGHPSKKFIGRANS